MESSRSGLLRRLVVLLGCGAAVASCLVRSPQPARSSGARPQSAEAKRQADLEALLAKSGERVLVVDDGGQRCSALMGARDAGCFLQIGIETRLGIDSAVETSSISDAVGFISCPYHHAVCGRDVACDCAIGGAAPASVPGCTGRWDADATGCTYNVGWLTSDAGADPVELTKRAACGDVVWSCGVRRPCVCAKE